MPQPTDEPQQPSPSRRKDIVLLLSFITPMTAVVVYVLLHQINDLAMLPPDEFAANVDFAFTLAAAGLGFVVTLLLILNQWRALRTTRPVLWRNVLAAVLLLVAAAAAHLYVRNGPSGAGLAILGGCLAALALAFFARRRRTKWARSPR